MRTLILGNTSGDYHLGSVFLRASREIGIEATVVDTSFSAYAPSMLKIYGKVFFRLSQKRPLEWWRFNKAIAAEIKSFQPLFVLIIGIIPVAKRVFTNAKHRGAFIANYLPDSPWSPQNSSLLFRRDLKNYNLVVSTKKDLIPQLRRAGAVNARFLPFGYDPSIHYSPKMGHSELPGRMKFPDVCLIGGADRERVRFIKEFCGYYNGSLGLYGSYWERNRETKSLSRGMASTQQMREIVAGSRINLGIVRRANLDGHSMRSFEIPACGGLGIYEDTAEHRDIFAGYSEEGFFSGPEDMARKCKLLLADQAKREEMRRLGMRLVRHEGNTYAARLRTMIEWAKE